MIKKKFFCSVDCGTKQGLVELESKKIKQRIAVNLSNTAISRIPRKNKKPHEQTKADLLQMCLKLAQKTARIRDKDLGCITCEKTKNYQGVWDGAHFISKTSSFARLNLNNIHKACEQCNRFATDKHHAAYEPALRIKIGDAKVDFLKANKDTIVKHQNKDYFIKYLRVMRKYLKRIEARL